MDNGKIPQDNQPYKSKNEGTRSSCPSSLIGIFNRPYRSSTPPPNKVSSSTGVDRRTRPLYHVYETSRFDFHVECHTLTFGHSQRLLVIFGMDAVFRRVTVGTQRFLESVSVYVLLVGVRSFDSQTFRTFKAWLPLRPFKSVELRRRHPPVALTD